MFVVCLMIFFFRFVLFCLFNVDIFFLIKIGVYGSWKIKLPKQQKTLKLILLDVRYNRDLNPNDLLGEQQWQWLENELKNDVDSDITLIGR
jgi:hypothetical protein